MYSNSNVFFRNTSMKVSKGQNVSCTMMVPQGRATRIGVNLDFGAHGADPYLNVVLRTRGLGFWFVRSFCRIGF